VFTPGDASYVPYTNGRWTNTDYGFTWVSNDPFGWATDHYGRWVWANRWVWRPDTTWGPAWVQWRQGDGYVGWAPAGYSDDAYFPDDHWRFVPVTYLFAADTPRYVIRGNVRPYLSSTFVVRRYGHDRRNHTWVLGPDDDWLRRNRVEVRRERVDAYALGRFARALAEEAVRLEVPVDMDVDIDHAGHQRHVTQVVSDGALATVNRDDLRSADFDDGVRARSAAPVEQACCTNCDGISRGTLWRAARRGETQDDRGQCDRGSDRRDGHGRKYSAASA
jgi:hypothetical protein